MQRYLIILFLALAAVVNAHFQLHFPPPRGVFNEDNEPKLCDGYNQAAANRTSFPLSGGFFSLNSEHPQFTTGVFVATVANPTSFNDFTQFVPFAQTRGEGLFCFPLNLPSNGFKDGQNVTIQIVFDGGDGNLYQCADLTLSSSTQISSDVKCSNATGNSNTTPATTPAASSTDAGSTGAPGASQTAGAIRESYPVLSLGLLFAVCSFIALAS